MNAQANLFPPEACDQGQGVEVAKDNGKDKETNLSSEAIDAAKAEDAVVKAKVAEAKSKEADPKVADAPTSQSSDKENPPPKAKA